MSEDEFRRLSFEVLYEMQLDPSDFRLDLVPKMRRLQTYIIEHENNQEVQEFITILLDRYKALFVDQKLIDALFISEYYHYYRQLRVYPNLPYTTHSAYANYLPKILDIPQNLFADFYETFIYVIEHYGNKQTSVEYLKMVRDFAHDNYELLHASKDKYYSLDDEKRLYDAAYKGYTFKELIEFGEDEGIHDDFMRRKSFINKRMGNIGEYLAYELYNRYKLNSFVSKDIKNGFGYDIYFLDDNHTENLVEVKSTMNYSDSDYFSVTRNELKTLRDCLNRRNAKYMFCRVILDRAFNPTFLFLRPESDEVLIDSSNTHQYRLSKSSLTFQKEAPKAKILTI